MRRWILPLIALLLVFPLTAEVKFVPGFQVGISTAPIVDAIRIQHIDGRTDVLEANGSIGFIFEPALQFIQETYEIRTGAGIGFLHSNLFNSGYFSLEGSLLFQTSTHFLVGPHLGTFYLLSAWSGDKTSYDDVTVEMTQPGILFGVSISSLGFGTRMIGSIDFMMGKMEVEGHGGWQSNEDEIDYQGITLRMGLGF